jgi:hypothetical protein
MPPRQQICHTDRASVDVRCVEVCNASAVASECACNVSASHVASHVAYECAVDCAKHVTGKEPSIVVATSEPLIWTAPLITIGLSFWTLITAGLLLL